MEGNGHILPQNVLTLQEKTGKQKTKNNVLTESCVTQTFFKCIEKGAYEYSTIPMHFDSTTYLV